MRRHALAGTPTAEGVPPPPPHTHTPPQYFHPPWRPMDKDEKSNFVSFDTVCDRPRSLLEGTCSTVASGLAAGQSRRPVPRTLRSAAARVRTSALRGTLDSNDDLIDGPAISALGSSTWSSSPYSHVRQLPSGDGLKCSAFVVE